MLTFHAIFMVTMYRTSSVNVKKILLFLTQCICEFRISLQKIGIITNQPISHSALLSAGHHMCI
jgi:hypothetical protein